MRNGSQEDTDKRKGEKGGNGDESGMENRNETLWERL